MKEIQSILNIAVGVYLLSLVPSFAVAVNGSKELKPDWQVVSKPLQGPSLQSSKTMEQIHKGSQKANILEQEAGKGARRLQFGGMDGGGGDEVGIEFQKTILDAIQGLQRKFPEVFHSLEKYNLAELANEIKIVVVQDALDVKVKDYIQESVAVNFPETKTILLNRKRWDAIQNQSLREAIALHETLSLVQVESTGSYQISSKYLASQNMSSKELRKSLEVNRLQQIRFSNPQAAPYEILEKVYTEAKDPIGLEDLARFSDKENFECSGQAFDMNNRKWSKMLSFELKFYENDSVREFAEKVANQFAGKEAPSSHGPLFPKEVYPSFYLESSDIGILSIAQEKQTTSLSDVKLTSTEIQEKTEYKQNFETAAVAHVAVRKSSGMLFFKKMYTESERAYKYKVIGYCYPKAGK